MHYVWYIFFLVRDLMVLFRIGVRGYLRLHITGPYLRRRQNCTFNGSRKQGAVTIEAKGHKDISQMEAHFLKE
jgi:hypothetical protein